MFCHIAPLPCDGLRAVPNVEIGFVLAERLRNIDDGLA